MTSHTLPISRFLSHHCYQIFIANNVGKMLDKIFQTNETNFNLYKPTPGYASCLLVI